MNYFPVRKKVKKQEFLPALTNITYDMQNIPYEGNPSTVVPPAEAIVYKNEIHLLGGGVFDTEKFSHRKLDIATDTLVKVGSLPFAFDAGSAVVLNDEIHLLGSNREPTKHYKWDGETWTEVSTIPFNVYYSVAVVLNNEIHLIGASNSAIHYKWDGETWTYIDSIPFSPSAGKMAALVLDGEIHFLSTDGVHRKWDGETWTQVSTLPSNTIKEYKMATVMNGLIIVAGSSYQVYKYDPRTNKWEQIYLGSGHAVSSTRCNVSFGGWHVFFASGSSITHRVVCVPTYIPID